MYNVYSHMFKVLLLVIFSFENYAPVVYYETPQNVEGLYNMV